MKQQLAINAVNSEADNPSACAVIDVTYVPGPSLGAPRPSTRRSGWLNSSRPDYVSTSYNLRSVPMST
jgi:hypothetical protein